MNVTPRNRHLLVEVVEPVEVQPTILVPDDYTAAREHELVKVLASSSDDYEPEQYVIVDGHMIKEVSVLGQDYCLVLENYVLAVVTGAEL